MQTMMACWWTESF